MSFTANTQQVQANTVPNAPQQVAINSITLPNVGTYVIGGQQGFSNPDPTISAIVVCRIVSDPQTVPQTVLDSYVTIPPGGLGTLPINGYIVVGEGQAPMTLTLGCDNGPTTGSQFPVLVGDTYYGTLTAIQVQ